MRRPLIAGNWKMNLDRAGAVKLAREIVEKAGSISKADLLVSPAFVHLDAVRDVLADGPVALSAQDVYYEANGAFTGEISTSMLADLGCRYVILGHSERRHVLGETDEQVRAKTAAALAAAITPIVCVGELLAERESGATGAVIRRQIEGSLAGFTADQIAQTVIAYEPVWAIGTGKVASPEQAEAVHLDLRRILAERYNAATADRVRILYGGS